MRTFDLTLLPGTTVSQWRDHVRTTEKSGDGCRSMPEDQSVGPCLMRYSTADLFFGVVSPSLFPSWDNPQGSGTAPLDLRSPGAGFEIRVFLLLGEQLTKTREPHLPFASYTAGNSVLHANLAYTYCSYRLPGVQYCLGPAACRVAA